MGEERMRVVQFVLDKKVEELPEHTLLALQGEITPSDPNGTLKGKYFGDLHYGSSGQAVLLTGQHVHKGQMKPLDKTILKFRRERDENGESRYVAVAVIKNKVLFKDRPLPNIPKL